MIINILGWVLTIEGILLFVPFFIDLIYKEGTGRSYLITAACTITVGLIIARNKPKSTVFYLKEGCAATALSWITISFIGAIPLFVSGDIPSFIDALFESVSGFTTTGATILSDVEALSHAGLFWRSLTHWIGGVGVLMFLLTVIPLTGGSSTNLMRAETSGPVSGKVAPKIMTTARMIYLIYIVLTVAELFALRLAGMDLFDATTTSLSNAATGGLAAHTTSMAAFSPSIQWIVVVFMILFSINFNVFYLIMLGQLKNALTNEQLRWYLGIIVFAVAVIFIDFIRLGIATADTFRETAFSVTSVLSSTGFAVADYNLWPDTARVMLVLLMFVGGCAGSTSGGILKISRFVIILKTLFAEIYSYIHPRSVKVIKSEGKPVSPNVIRSIYSYFGTYLLIMIISLILVSLNGYDLVTTATSVFATTNNIGPGLGLVGPMGNYGDFSVLSKIVFMFDMFIGRLEIFPLIILFSPGAWKNTFRHR